MALPLVLLLVLCIYLPSVSGNERHYYIAAVEVEWNYAPSGMNLFSAENAYSRARLVPGKNRIGSMYTKAIYRAFTDATFSTPVPVPEWMGLLGPPIRAEVGDVVFIHFKNMASGSSFSVHPHGFLYDKANEGALSIDGTEGFPKMDDKVKPGGSITYRWVADKIHAPTEDDDNCVPWAYHSHVRATKDIDTGLVGFIVICRKGILDAAGHRMDIDKEFYLYADIADENNNWYFDKNLYRCGDPMACDHLKQSENRAFKESNEFYHINGMTFGNLPDFQTCEGEKVVWYFMSLNLGVHTMHANGQTMIIEKKRTDTVILHQASFYSGYMIPINPGRWALYCRDEYNLAYGMEAYLDVKQCFKKSPLPKTIPQLTRTYFIAIEEVLWDYAPGLNLKAINIPAAQIFLAHDKNRIGSVYKKAIYREYKDGTFTKPMPRGPFEEHYGLAGPPIKAEVGDRIVVVLLNRASRPYSLLAHGVAITKENEGMFYKNSRKDPHESGAIVLPGSVREYTFDVPVTVEPTPINTNCITYMYHSAVDMRRDVHSGLFGPMLVCKHGTLTPSGKQKGVDREFFLNWQVIDENLSWYIGENRNAFTAQGATGGSYDQNAAGYNQNGGNYDQNGGNYDQNAGAYDQMGGNYDHTGGIYNPAGGNYDQMGGNYDQNGGNYDQNGGMYADNGGNYNQMGGNYNQMGGNYDQMGGNYDQMGGNYDQNGGTGGNYQNSQISNQIRAINGHTFGTLHGLHMCIGDKVTWHMYGLGEKDDHHHFTFDSNNFLLNNRHLDAASVFAGSGETVIMKADQAGRHILRTGQLGHESEGMFAWYDVGICTEKGLAKTVPLPLIPHVKGVVRRIYIGIVEDDWDYCPVKIDPVTGESLFNPHLKSFPYVRDDKGFMGTIYRKALYREFTDESFSKMKPRSPQEKHLGMQGPFIRGNVGDFLEIVLKNFASFPYNLVPRNLPFADGSSITDALPTLPGEIRVYKYVIPERSGPLPHQPNCVGSMYTSRVTPINDTYSGLFGPVVICKPGIIDLAGRRTDKVTAEFATAFVIIDENKSHYSRFNFASKVPERKDISESHFVESNNYYTINGLIYGNLHGLVFHEGEQSAWYVFALGSTTGVHTVHFHGQLYLRTAALTLKRDVLEVFSGTYETVEMLGYNPGTWLFHCHVSPHTSAGMKTSYTVLPTNHHVAPPPPPPHFAVAHPVKL